ncbi:hypothetical protein pdam_00025080 [Pocillopora damicornis]|uniref:OB domain-containing protein n=1 Tax=Pocillopora damicornis TaxID=46731 RepID=A0A3M6UNP3_POCDA|nr:hypothetical protein pdam_00025080 [Pocillopora damicornis]
MAISFKYVPPAAPSLTSVADVLKTKRQGDMVTISGLIRWDSEASTPQNSKRPVRDGKLVDSTGTIDISIWSDHTALIKEGDFFEISNCNVKHYYGLKISTTTETIIKPAEKQNITNVNTDATAIKPQICCPEIQNVIIDTNAMCNTKGCKSKITGNTESKVMVSCTACNRAMLVKNCYVDMCTTFQLEKEEKQFNVVANYATLSVYLNEDIFQYRKNIDELTEKLLLLENVDFTLSKNERSIQQTNFSMPFKQILFKIALLRRCKGIPMAIDGLGGGTNSIMAKINSLTVRADLTRYGFVINEEKSLWKPVQVITCLGTVFDTYQGLISVTERRVSKLKSSIDLLRKDNCKILKVRDVASVVSQVILLTPCVGSVAKIMTRALYTVVNQKQSWDSQVELSKEAFDELTFWIDNVDSLNFRCLSNRLLDLSILTHQITLVVLLLKE